FFFFSSRRRHTRCLSDWSSDVCSSDLFGLDGRAKGDGFIRILRSVELRSRSAVIFCAEAESAAGFLELRAAEKLGHKLAHERHRSEERRVGKGGRWWWVAGRVQYTEVD